MVGLRFGRWLVVERGPCDDKGRDRWKCRCDCGTVSVVRGKDLRGGSTLSCGCYRKERVVASHTKHQTPRKELYDTWSKMLRRCYNQRDSGYRDYGLRGIAVCPRWRDGDGERTGFDCFVSDMGPRPTNTHMLERVDNDGHYSPENCRWADRTEQMNNRRNNIRISHGGESHTLGQWARILGVGYSRLYSRWKKGYSAEYILKAGTCPRGPRKNHG